MGWIFPLTFTEELNMSFQCLLSQGNDHRWTATFAPSLQLISMTMSRSFQFDKRENWAAKLKEVHSFAWKQWTENLSHKKGYQLSADKIQSAGVVSEGAIGWIGTRSCQHSTKNSVPKEMNAGKKGWLSADLCALFFLQFLICGSICFYLFLYVFIFFMCFYAFLFFSFLLIFLIFSYFFIFLVRLPPPLNGVPLNGLHPLTNDIILIFLAGWSRV